MMARIATFGSTTTFGTFRRFASSFRQPRIRSSSVRSTSARARSSGVRRARIALVASVDFAHVGPKYGDPDPVTAARLAEVLAGDRVLLEHAAAVAPDAWLRALHAEHDARNVCGAAPTWTLLEVLRDRGLAGTVLRHDHWQIDPATQSHVSFAAIAYA